MKSSYPYKILVVSPDSIWLKTVENILAEKQITPIYVNSAKAAINEIKSHKSLFSMVIVSQELEDMPSVEFLDIIRNLCKGALRALVNKGFEKDLLMYVVNHRLVHKYIGDPSDVEEFTAVIESGIRRFNRFREDEDLFILAKKQNHKLYELNCEHLELTRSLNKEIAQLNAQIKRVYNKLKYLTVGHPEKIEALVPDIIALVQGDPDPQARFDSLFEEVLISLNMEFSDLQVKGGKDHE